VTLYARADVSYVSVPRENGGCGEPHSRPVFNGAPAKQFILNCQPCENFLRADIARSGGNKKVRTINGDTGLALRERYLGLWGATADTTPETPDDELKREADEARMVATNAASQTQTFAQIGQAIAGNAELMSKFIELQASLMAKTAEPAPKVLQAAVEPPADGYNVKHCVDCGTLIERRPGTRGALPKRCPDCKQKAAA
jgi:hypothetical protein